MRTSLRIATLLSLAAVPVAAQQVTHEHKGFWIGFGFGVGENLSTGFEAGQLAGGAGYIRLGGTVRQGLMLGFDGMAWVNEDRGRGNGVFSVTWYPSRQRFYLKGGLGIATAGRSTTSGNTTASTSVDGFGVTAGLGLDLKIGRNIYLVPAVDFLGQFFKEQTDPVLGNIPAKNSILIGSLGLLWH